MNFFSLKTLKAKSNMEKPSNCCQNKTKHLFPLDYNPNQYRAFSEVNIKNKWIESVFIWKTL